MITRRMGWAPGRGGAVRAALLALAAAVTLVLLFAIRALDRGGAARELRPALEGDVAARADDERSEAAQAALEALELPGGRAEVATGAELGPGVRLSGPGRLVGRVRAREDGQGVSGARVELLALPPAGILFVDRMLRLSGVGPGVERRSEPIAVATSGADGSFSFDGVREGTYYVEVKSATHVPEGPGRAEVVASGIGGPIELWMRSGGRVSGTFMRRGGAPVGGATVVLEPGPGLALSAARAGALRPMQARTDSEGRFAFFGVAPGAGYEVSAIGARTAISHALELEVVAGRETFVALEARAGGELTGRVLSASQDGEAGGGDEPEPLAGAHVGAVPRGLRDLRLAAEILSGTHAVTDGAGRYTIAHAPPGELDVVAVAGGHVAGVAGPLRVAEGALARVPDLTLESGPMVRGRVVDGEGTPIAGVRVRWETFDWRALRSGRVELSFAPFLAQAVDGFEYPVTGSDGAFVAGPFPGEAPYRIDFYAPGFQDLRRRWTPGEEPEELEVVLRRGGAIEGLAMDLARAEPVTRFSVETSDRIELAADAPGRFNPFSGGQHFENPAGRFTLDAMRTGKVKLTFRADGYMPAIVEDVEVLEGRTTRGLIVKMVPGGAVRGTVADRSGRPVVGAHVLALPADGGARPFDGRGRRARRGPPADLARELPPALFSYAAGVGLLAEVAARSAADGTFELLGVEPGAAVIVALHPDHVPGRSEQLHVAEGESVEDVAIELSAGGGIHGIVEDRHGRPLPGSIVIALSPARFGAPGPANFGGGLYQGLADAAGEYRIEHMSPGGYLVVATRGDESLDPASLLGSVGLDLVTVPAEEVVRFDIVDESAGATRVFGRVTDGGAPVERGNLSAVGFGAGNLLGVDFKVARLREGGAYEFPGLAPGEYQLQLEGAGPRTRMRIDVPDLPEHRIDLELPSGSVEGVVVDAATGRPAPRCEVLLRFVSGAEPKGVFAALIGAEGRLERARTDTGGAFRFARLQEGAYELTARPAARDDELPLGPSGPLELELGRGELRRGLRIELPAAFTLRGSVRAEEGGALAGARVSATRAGAPDPRAARARTRDDGRFEIAGLGPGEYLLAVSADGYAARRLAELSIGPEEPGEVEIVLHRGIELALVVLARDGRPVSGARARVVPLDGPPPDALDAEGAFRSLFRGEGASDESGRLELGRFAPGEYELTVWRGFARVVLPEVALAPGSRSLELSVTLP